MTASVFDCAAAAAAVHVDLGECDVKACVIVVACSRRGWSVGGRVSRTGADVDDECRLVGKMTNEVVVQMHQQTQDAQHINYHSNSRAIQRHIWGQGVATVYRPPPTFVPATDADAVRFYRGRGRQLGA